MVNDQLRMIRGFVAVLAVATMLPGCAKLKMYDVTDPFGLINSYQAAKDDFDRGRIMEARSEVLAMDKRRSDYARAQALLRDRIEPARLHLLHYYTAKAEVAERQRRWSVAMGMYEQAASFSIHAAVLQRKQRQMSLKMRQVRLSALLAQRRREDETILSWQRAYRIPRGVDANDPAYRRQEEVYAALLDQRASDAYADAKRYLRKEMPELAYIEIESYLRYEPDSEKGKALQAEIRQAMPAGLSIRPERGRHGTRKMRKMLPMAPITPMVRQPESNTVDAEDIQNQIQQGHWLEARRLALVYRREGGKGAAALLTHIQTQIASRAADAFQQGRVAFRKENIDAAVGHWKRAVELMPDETEYVESLERARQLQDRLRILREATTDGKLKPAPRRK
jgi:tetratricopeptide (TPR) repeat protein